MTPNECQELCEAVGLNVKAVSQTARSIVVMTGQDRRDAQNVIARLRKLIHAQGYTVKGIVFSQSPHSDDEYSFQVL